MENQVAKKHVKTSKIFLSNDLDALAVRVDTHNLPTICISIIHEFRINEPNKNAIREFDIQLNEN